MRRLFIIIVSLALVVSAGIAQGQAGVTLQVDANAALHSISPNIYGMNLDDPELAADIRLPINRWGGNATTRYNWQNDTANHASDWYFENIPKANANEAALPNGSAADNFISDNMATNTETLLTIPMIGWTPKSREYPYLCGFSVEKYGDQQDTDWEWQPDCGNGIDADGDPIVGNDPTDTSVAIGPSFVTAWMAHIEDQFGAGAVRYYNLDNEPSLWNSTHRDVFPTGLSYDDLRDRTYAYGAAIKAADPSALTLGPVEYGWTGYFYSGLDAAQPGNWWENPIDRSQHDDKPLVQWYLEQMKAYQQTHGVRILDYFDLHYYPATPGVTLSEAGDASIQEKRLKSTRSLWDAAYIDDSWIGDENQAIRQVNLIPRMRDWVNNYYPGTRLAISEYNFGGLEHINGALTQADVLGIFGREGMGLATLWDPPTRFQPGAYAFRMYRNYNGVGGAFGETGVSAVSSDEWQLSVYAAKRADGALTIMVINKTGGSLTSPLTISNFNGSMAEVYRYSSANLNQIVRQADVEVSGGSLTFPANSITLLVVNPGNTANAKPTPHYFTTQQPTLTWAAVSWALGYEIEIARSNNFLPLFKYDNVAANSLSYQTPELDYGTWFWRIRAVKSVTPFAASAWTIPESFVVGSS